MNSETRRKSDKKFRLIDFLIILIFLFISAVCVNLFRLDLRRTLASHDEKPVGIIIIKNNIVQRRLADRVIWDRLYADSPVYSGDLIRVANHSAANITIENASLDLDENTLVRIIRSPDGEGSIRIELNGGSLGIDTGADGGSFILDIMGNEAKVGPGTVLNAGAGADGVVLQVSEGTVFFNNGNQNREIVSGDRIALDAKGAERTDPAVVMVIPRLNARYLKSGVAPLPINFSWGRVNIAPNDPLCLEIATDRNFTRVSRIIESTRNMTQTALDAGLWHWRILHGSNVLYTGHFTVTDASVIALFSPAMDSVFYYRDTPPRLSFQWSEVEDAAHYMLEVSETPDFSNLRINRQTAANAFTDASFGEGTWHWRVRPVFPTAYEGNAVYSSAASFRIEYNDMAETLVAAMPQPKSPPPPPRPAPRPAARPTPRPQPTPVPPLPMPENRLPATGYRIGVEELQSQRSIAFSWSAVSGANAYIFTLYQQTPNGRRQIIRRNPENYTGWTLDDFKLLDRGTFVWQVEAVSRIRNGTIERRGTIGENSFTVDVPIPGPVRLEGTGIFYGN